MLKLNCQDRNVKCASDGGEVEMRSRIETRIVAALGVVLSVLFLFFGILKIMPWEVAGTLTATTIGLVSIILAVERREPMSREITTSEKAKIEIEGKLLWEESILVSKASCSHYNLKVGENEKVTGEISSNDYFDVYFLTPRNFTEYDNDEDFSYEYGTEHASKMRVNFIPKKPGKFYCTIHNEADKDIDVNVKLYLTKIKE
jgi:hypothetical protein